jgi:hypothetical protein
MPAERVPGGSVIARGDPAAIFACLVLEVMREAFPGDAGR